MFGRIPCPAHCQPARRRGTTARAFALAVESRAVWIWVHEGVDPVRSVVGRARARGRECRGRARRLWQRGVGGHDVILAWPDATCRCRWLALVYLACRYVLEIGVDKCRSMLSAAHPPRPPRKRPGSAPASRRSQGAGGTKPASTAGYGIEAGAGSLVQVGLGRGRVDPCDVDPPWLRLVLVTGVPGRASGAEVQAAVEDQYGSVRGVWRKIRVRYRPCSTSVERGSKFAVVPAALHAPLMPRLFCRVPHKHGRCCPRVTSSPC